MQAIATSAVRASYWILTVLSVLFLVRSIINFSTNNVVLNGVVPFFYASLSFSLACVLEYFFGPLANRRKERRMDEAAGLAHAAPDKGRAFGTTLLPHQAPNAAVGIGITAADHPDGAPYRRRIR